MAAGFSNAFSSCTNLSELLEGLESRGAPSRADKPQALKRKAPSLLVPKQKAKPSSCKHASDVASLSPAAPVPAAKPPAPVPAARAAAAPAANAAANPAPAAKPAGAGLSDSRNCVHSRAYKAAAKIAKAAGKSKTQISLEARAAGKADAAQWDIDHPDG